MDGIYSRKVKLSQIFTQNFLEVIVLKAYLMKTCYVLPEDRKLFFIKVNLAVHNLRVLFVIIISLFFRILLITNFLFLIK